MSAHAGFGASEGVRARRAVRRRAARRARVRRAVGLLAVLVCLALAAEAAYRRGTAQAEVAQALRAWHAGRYADAAAGLAAARSAWPWAPVAGLEATAEALARSAARYRRGVAALEAGDLGTAVADLEAVRPDDVHHARAAALLASLREAAADLAQADAVGRAADAWQRDLSALWAAYQLAQADLIPAWEEYGFGDPTPYEHAAAAPVAALGAQARRLASDARDVALAAPGSAGATLAATLAARAEDLAARTANALRTLEAASPVVVDQAVPQELQAVGADAAALRAGAPELPSDLAAQRQALLQAAQALLGPRGTLQALAAAAPALHQEGPGG
jgi:hypothetical protein